MKQREFRNFYKQYIYVPKHEKLSETTFRSRMTVSLLTIVACVTLMVSSAFAFFSMDVSTGTSTIAAGNYTVKVNSATGSVYTCRLAYDDLHLFELTAEGTASTGYCKVLIDDEVYYTQQIPQGDSLLLTVQAAQGTEIRFVAYWGQYATSGSAVRYTHDDVIYYSQTEHAVYEVQDGATIADIAAHYGVTPEDICVYNGLSDDMIALFSRPSATPQQITFSIDTPLSAGLVLKIPGVPADAEPYIVPEEPEEDEDKDADEEDETVDETADNEAQNGKPDGEPRPSEDEPADEDKEPERSDEPNAPEGDSDTEGSDTDVTNPDKAEDNEGIEDTESEDSESENTSSADTNTDIDAVKPEDAESDDTLQDAGEAEDADSDGTDSEQSDLKQTDAESADSGAADAVTSGSAYAFS